MKIIKEGKLPKLKQYKGVCNTCGCEFIVDSSEVEWEEDRGQDHPTYRRCPFGLCPYGSTIYLTEIKEVEADWTDPCPCTKL